MFRVFVSLVPIGVLWFSLVCVLFVVCFCVGVSLAFSFGCSVGFRWFVLCFLFGLLFGCPSAVSLIMFCVRGCSFGVPLVFFWLLWCVGGLIGCVVGVVRLVCSCFGVGFMCCLLRCVCVFSVLFSGCRLVCLWCYCVVCVVWCLVCCVWFRWHVVSLCFGLFVCCRVGVVFSCLVVCPLVAVVIFFVVHVVVFVDVRLLFIGCRLFVSVLSLLRVSFSFGRLFVGCVSCLSLVSLLCVGDVRVVCFVGLWAFCFVLFLRWLTCWCFVGFSVSCSSVLFCVVVGFPRVVFVCGLVCRLFLSCVAVWCFVWFGCVLLFRLCLSYCVVVFVGVVLFVVGFMLCCVGVCVIVRSLVCVLIVLWFVR